MGGAAHDERKREPSSVADARPESRERQWTIAASVGNAAPGIQIPDLIS
jgi:hypothetical protein